MKSSLSTTGLLKTVTGGFDVKPTINPDTILDTKYRAGTPDLTSNEMTKVKYLGIGMGGCITYSSNTVYSLRPRRPIDVDLVTPIPMVIVDPNDDLTPSERAKYRARVVTTLGGVEKVFYYLYDISEKIADNTNAVNVRLADADNTIIDLQTTDDIPDGTNSLYYSADITIPIILESDVTTRLKHAIMLLYPTDPERVISEIGLYSGVDADVDGEIDATRIQLHLSISDVIPTNASTIPITIKMAMGIT